MGLDVFLQRFANGGPIEVDRRRVRDVLATQRFRGPDAHGFYVVSFPDGAEVEFSAGGLDSIEPFTGCAFHIRGVNDGLIAFIFDVARAGDMVIIPAIEGNPLILVSDTQEANVPADVREHLQPVLVRSARDLGPVLFADESPARDPR